LDNTTSQCLNENTMCTLRIAEQNNAQISSAQDDKHPDCSEAVGVYLLYM